MVEARRERRLSLHRLSLKIAWPVAAVVFVGAFAARLAGLGLPLWSVALAALVAGAAAYGAALRALARRLDLARTTLRQIRHRQFENLEAARLPRGDELNDLVWQVYRTGQALEREIRELKRIENYRREFLGNVSHELKTPIFSIRGFAETLLGGALEDARVRQSFVEKILRNAERLGNLTEDLGAVARIEMGELQMTMAAFALPRLVEEVIESMEPMAAGQQIDLAQRLPAEVPAVWGDRERLRQVLVNLVDNAIKYNQAGGRVEIVARQASAETVKISVVDDGIGIAPEHIERLTERFFRVDASRSRSQGGTGLGLAIVKHILSAHQSQLLVESRAGKGSTFGFSLPVAPLSD